MPSGAELRILVPVDVSGPEQPDLELDALFAPTHVVLLGYVPVPDQATPARIKAESEAEARARLDAVAAAVEAGGAEVETVLVFTHDREDTIDRVAEEHRCDAVLTTGDAESVESILVPLRGESNLDRIVGVVATLERSGDEQVTVLHALDSDADPTEGEFLVRGAVDRLHEEGIDRERVDWEVASSDDPETTIVDAAAGYDLVVIGETKPTLTQRILGDVPSRVVDAITGPVLVVRNVE